MNNTIAREPRAGDARAAPAIDTDPSTAQFESGQEVFVKPGEVRLGQGVWWAEEYWRVMGVYDGGWLLRLARPTHYEDGSFSFAENVVDDVPVEFVSPHGSRRPDEK
ncbi:hypothetical protein CS378_05465 [Rhodococcus ruber]|nr:hypothetical protein CS378_05465 [Rhodococcus ruber]AUM17177.1 hypothetical protein CSW53_12000 [Rhodococcus ruber]MBD8054489.1 hypothetical protein [Rhodococcus ruber]